MTWFSTSAVVPGRVTFVVGADRDVAALHTVPCDGALAAVTIVRAVRVTALIGAKC